MSGSSPGKGQTRLRAQIEADVIYGFVDDWSETLPEGRTNLPVLVISSLTFLANVLGPNSFESAKASRGFDVANQTDTGQRRSLDHCHSFHDFFLVHLWTGSVSFADDVGHPGFVANEACQVNRLRWIVFGESLHLSTKIFCSFFRVESHWTVTRGRELTMRLEW